MKFYILMYQIILEPESASDDLSNESICSLQAEPTGTNVETEMNSISKTRTISCCRVESQN